MEKFYKPRYVAEMKQVACQLEIDRLRKMKQVFIDSGLEHCDEAKKVDKQITNKLMQIKELSEIGYTQHLRCGGSLIAVFIALDLLTETLDNMNSVFKECAVLDAKDAGIDFSFECKKLASECNKLVCYLGKDNYVDEQYGEMSTELVDELKDRIDEVVSSNEYKILR